MTPSYPLYPTRGLIAYGASKTAAEQAVWEFRKQHSPPFALTTVHPSLVFGAPAIPPKKPQHISASLFEIYDIWAGPANGPLRPQISTGSWIHVSDVANIHLWAAEHPAESDGERFIGAAGFAAPQAVADILREKFPERERIKKGVPGTGYQRGVDWNGREARSWYPDDAVRVSGEKSASVMGITYKTLEETLVESVAALKGVEFEAESGHAS
jgi:nucleoside-diphosphate-sugar epimerase